MIFSAVAENRVVRFDQETEARKTPTAFMPRLKAARHIRARSPFRTFTEDRGGNISEVMSTLDIPLNPHVITLKFDEYPLSIRFRLNEHPGQIGTRLVVTLPVDRISVLIDGTEIPLRGHAGLIEVSFDSGNPSNSDLTRVAELLT